MPSCKHHVGGFTLLEVLVALFIAAISVGALGMTLGQLQSESEFNTHVEQFSLWLERTRQHAVVRNMTYSVDYDEENNTFLLQEYRQDGWTTAYLDVSAMQNPASIQVVHVDENEPQLKILIFPDYTYSDFEFIFTNDSEKKLSVYGDGISNLNVGETKS